MWDIKQKVISEQTKQTNRLIDTNNRVVVTRGEGGGGRTKRIKGVKSTVTETE